MRKKETLFFVICMSAALTFTACSSTESDSVEAEEGWDWEDWEEQEGEEITEGSDDLSYITGLISGLEDCYIMEGSSDIDYEDGLVIGDPDVITGIITDDSDVDLSTPGVYTVAFTLIVDDDVPGEEPIGDVKVYRTVEVVDDDRAAELAAEGKLIWESNNAVIGICGTDYGISTLPPYIRYTVEDITDDVATCLIKNYSGYEITYGLYFDLEAENGDDWIPLERLADVMFEDAEYTLADQSEVEIECDLSPYGELSDGNYRILKDDIYVEFTIENEKLVINE